MNFIQTISVMFQDPMVLITCAAGVFLGIYVGCIPGLSGAMAVSLLVSLTYGWSTNHALAMMIGVYNGAAFGGSRSAILLNIPGAPAAVATGFDGYPLAKKGLAGQAMGISTLYSVIGGILGSLALCLFTPLLSSIARKFVARDYILMSILGLMLVGNMGGKSLAKSFFSAALGILLGCVGMDSMTSAQRFCFGNVYLMAGINSTVSILAFFGVSEAILQVKNIHQVAVKQKVDKIIPNLKSIKKHFGLALRTAFIGVIVGVLPGSGGSIASMMAYDHAKRTVKNPETPFGEGAIEGVIAPETSNNAAVGGALVPMLTLGIPGDSVTAIIMGALMIHGLQPGPNMLSNSPKLFSIICLIMFLSQIFMLVFGLTGIKLTTKLLDIPSGRLLPMVIILTAIGSFAINKNLYDIIWMGGLGLLAYIMKSYDYPVAPAVLGLILASMIEKNYKIIAITAAAKGGFFNTFVVGLFTSPISLILFLIIIISFFTQTKLYKKLVDKVFSKK